MLKFGEFGFDGEAQYCVYLVNLGIYIIVLSLLNFQLFIFVKLCPDMMKQFILLLYAGVCFFSC